MKEQNNIQNILIKNPIIPVVTFNSMDEIEPIIQKIIKNNVNCIEITLRTSISIDAIKYIKDNYFDKLDIGVGTVKNEEEAILAQKLEIDFIVAPGITKNLNNKLEETNIPFLYGVCNPSQIMLGMEMNHKFFKFFPANLFGGINSLKTYLQLFPDIKFCPTGGINQGNYNEYLKLENVISVGGSWVINESLID